MDEFLIIKHPCVIKDGSEEKALKMMGGLDQVERTFNMDNMRMQLNFRTDGDCCSKGTFGSHKDVIGFWATVRQYKNRKTGEIKYQSQPLGFVRHVFDFEGMVDFQYLPSKKGKDVRNELVYSDIAENIETFVSQKTELLYMVPQVFTRMDVPFMGPYKHLSEMKTRRKDEAGNPLLRKARLIFTTLVRVLAPPNGDPTPEKPVPDALKQMESVDQNFRERVQEAFRRRPIWTKSALAHELKTERSQLRTVIVALAYCVNQGPFRMCYIRYGFDPRTDPSSKIYQTLDCRVKASTGIQRSTQSHFVPAQIAPSGSKYSISSKKKKENDEEMVLLRCKYLPGKMPPTRQLLYHLCDIEMDCVQQIVHRNDGAEEWTDADGWCSPGSMGHIRDYLTTDMKNSFDKLKLKDAPDMPPPGVAEAVSFDEQLLDSDEEMYAIDE